MILLSDNCRFRHSHVRVKHQVTEFTVQLEIYYCGRWNPFVRYDTVHGFAHRDFIHADGTIEKTPLTIGDFNVSLTFAESDLKSNWNLYYERFLREVKKDEE